MVTGSCTIEVFVREHAVPCHSEVPHAELEHELHSSSIAAGLFPTYIFSHCCIIPL